MIVVCIAGNIIYCKRMYLFDLLKAGSMKRERREGEGERKRRRKGEEVVDMLYFVFTRVAMLVILLFLDSSYSLVFVRPLVVPYAVIHYCNLLIRGFSIHISTICTILFTFSMFPSFPNCTSFAQRRCLPTQFCSFVFLISI